MWCIHTKKVPPKRRQMFKRDNSVAVAYLNIIHHFHQISFIAIPSFPFYHIRSIFPNKVFFITYTHVGLLFSQWVVNSLLSSEYQNHLDLPIDSITNSGGRLGIDSIAGLYLYSWWLILQQTVYLGTTLYRVFPKGTRFNPHGFWPWPGTVWGSGHGLISQWSS